MGGRYHVSLVMLMATMALIWDHVTHAESQTRPGLRRNRIKRTEGMDPSVFRTYLDLLQQQQSTTTEASPSWSLFIPRVPEESEIECYIEVVRVRRRGGRCTRLGGNTTQPYVCQRGRDTEFQDGCRQVLERRQLLQQQQQEQQQPEQ